MSYEPLCLCGRNISKKQMEMALMMMMRRMLMKKKISWSIRFLSLTITQCTSSRVRPSSSHQKTEERGKQQMTRKIDKTWGCRIAKSTLTGLVRLFFSFDAAAVLNLFGASGSMNDVTSLWQDLMKYCWYVTCQRCWLDCCARRPNCWPSIMPSFWHPIPRAFLAGPKWKHCYDWQLLQHPFFLLLEKSPFPHSLIDGCCKVPSIPSMCHIRIETTSKKLSKRWRWIFLIWLVDPRCCDLNSTSSLRLLTSYI